ncbi:leucyl aminopeptidase [Tenggerimyces flavus]|uniref:Probable cytosol aminopeptidase n=1 Tax=Tenggerimyces flavus TaxID=1708749 RepID=A0ABV7YN84_9ACTN|nr:leucyl aminopeptidase [Tenggerimyces flavus]MBM7788766.1 leucyl aminopeptidase [Tenggerimyces flavus]
MSTTSPTIAVRKAKSASIKTDAVVVGLSPGSDGVTLARGTEELDSAFGGKLAATFASVGATGKADEVTLIPSGGAVSAPVVVGVGLGSGSPTEEQVRRAAGAALRRLAGKATTVAFVLSSDEEPGYAGALTEGTLLGAYAFDQFRSQNGTKPTKIQTVTFVTDKAPDKAVKAAVARAEAIARAVNLTRDWINRPASDLHPVEFAADAKAAAKQYGLEFEVLDEKALTKGGYGGIMGVGIGSTNPPRLVRLAYRSSKAKRHLALVGKGITFDSGGLSLKPPDAMPGMKSDMSGAAAVLATVTAVAELGLPVNVTAWAPMAENMPSGTATRPSDVLNMYGGKTVEVLNTDAEGRLVLADAMVRAGEERPDILVDVATLTGACVVALGHKTYAIITHDTDFQQHVQQTAARVGENAWPLPIPEGSRERLDSKVADLANVASDRAGGALVAAAFLAEFLPEGVRWAHLDIAGTAFNDGGPFGYTPKGATGSSVRTLIGLAEDAAAGDL